MSIEPKKLAAILAAIARYRAALAPAQGSRSGDAWRLAGRKALMGGLTGEKRRPA
jgi:hypothetical protein